MNPSWRKIINLYLALMLLIAPVRMLAAAPAVDHHATAHAVTAVSPQAHTDRHAAAGHAVVVAGDDASDLSRQHDCTACAQCSALPPSRIIEKVSVAIAFAGAADERLDSFPKYPPLKPPIGRLA